MPRLPARAARGGAARARRPPRLPRPGGGACRAGATPPRSRPTGRALAQRNALLRRIRAGVADAAGLDVWDEQLADQGAALIAARARLCTRLAAPFAAHLEALGGRAGAILEYRPRVAADDLAAALAERRERDITRAATSAGPHLDDVVLHEQARELRSFGSQGEQRTAVLALLLAEATLVTELRGEPPVLLLDDVLSELDVERRARLQQAVRGIGQAIVTTTEAAHLPEPADRVLVVGRGAIAEGA